MIIKCLKKQIKELFLKELKEKLLDIAYDTFKDPDQDGIALSLRKTRLNIERIGTYGKCTTCKNT